MHTITKDQFVAILDSLGLTAAQKHQLHAELEKRHPDSHQAFLEWLHLAPAEIAAIRTEARS